MGVTATKVASETWDATTGTWNVDLTWETDPGTPVTTELNYGEVVSGACSMIFMPAYGPDCDGTHTYPLTGLNASSTYRFEAVSKDAGMAMTCDDGSTPFDYGTKAAPATTPAGVDSVSSSAPARAITLGGAVDISVTAVDAAGAVVSGETVNASVTNTPVHGTLSPASVDTDAAGKAVIAFTGTSRGTACITISCGMKDSKKMIWVCQKWYDYLLALLRIPF